MKFKPMTLEDACRIVDPDTRAYEMDEFVYYGGFSGDVLAREKLDEASRMVVDFVRQTIAANKEGGH